MTNVAISTDSLGGTNFLIGSYQATLKSDHHGGWACTYFKHQREVLTSSSPIHPTLPSNKSRAIQCVTDVIISLHEGRDLPPTTQKTKTPKPKRSRKARSVVTPQSVIESLLNSMDDSWTLLVPVGKPASLAKTTVRILDQNNELVCEIPFPKYQELTKSS